MSLQANHYTQIKHDLQILQIHQKQGGVLTSVTRPNPTKNTLSSFTPVSEEELLKILKSSPSKSCDLDPIPTSLVKECADILITPITKIVNYSITEGSFPNCFKMAYVTPFKRSRALIEISSKTTGRCQTSALYLNLLRRWWQSS